LPGPTALIPALAVSGLPTERFVFEGFLPQKKGRQTRLIQLAEEPRTMVFYESPHRLVKCLLQFAEFFGSTRNACVCRELSKMFEEIKRDTVEELAQYYNANPPKGEIVIVVEGISKEDRKKGKMDSNE
jgi:16S rRNA (cytidine1402-2'-O)-methyltransferase